MQQETPQINASSPGHLSQLRMTSTANLDTPTSFEQSRRQISSIVVAEEVLGPIPDANKITYIEVPVVKEVVRYVPKTSIVEVEKIVPKYEVEQVEHVVEVPQVEYIERTIEKIIQHEAGSKNIKEIPREVVKTVPKIEYVQTEKVVEVEGDLIEIPIIQRDAGITEDPDFVPDKNVPVVVAQTVKPLLKQVYESNEKVDVYQYNPSVVPVDVLVAKPVPSQLIAVGAISQDHRRVDISSAQYNTVLKMLNDNLSPEDQASLPYQIDEGYGHVTFLHPTHTPAIVENPDLQFSSQDEQQQQQHYQQQQQQQQHYQQQQQHYQLQQQQQQDASQQHRMQSHQVQQLPHQVQQQFQQHQQVQYQFQSAAQSGSPQLQTGSPQEVTYTRKETNSTSFKPQQPQYSQTKTTTTTSYMEPTVSTKTYTTTTVNKSSSQNSILDSAKYQQPASGTTQYKSTRQYSSMLPATATTTTTTTTAGSPPVVTTTKYVTKGGAEDLADQGTTKTTFAGGPMDKVEKQNISVEPTTVIENNDVNSKAMTQHGKEATTRYLSSFSPTTHKRFITASPPNVQYLSTGGQLGTHTKVTTTHRQFTTDPYSSLNAGNSHIERYVTSASQTTGFNDKTSTQVNHQTTERGFSTLGSTKHENKFINPVMQQTTQRAKTSFEDSTNYTTKGISKNETTTSTVPLKKRLQCAC